MTTRLWSMGGSLLLAGVSGTCTGALGWALLGSGPTPGAVMGGIIGSLAVSLWQALTLADWLRAHR